MGDGAPTYTVNLTLVALRSFVAEVLVGKTRKIKWKSALAKFRIRPRIQSAWLTKNGLSLRNHIPILKLARTKTKIILMLLDKKDDPGKASGISEWVETLDGYLFSTLVHYAPTVRGAAFTCSAGLTSSVLVFLPDSKQNFMISSIVTAASIRSVAC